jgi:hypothetical protein
VLGVVLIVRGYIGKDFFSRYLSTRRPSRATQWDRVLYLLVGCFFVAAEIAFFQFDVDWFNPSTYR